MGSDRGGVVAAVGAGRFVFGFRLVLASAAALALVVALVVAALGAAGAMAEEATCTSNGVGYANQAVREAQHSDFLPDCRAFEMVSPLDKSGGDVMANAGRTRSSVSGEAVDFASLTPFGDAVGSGLAGEYIGVRTGRAGTSGWATHSIIPSGPPSTFFEISRNLETFYTVFSDDLSSGILQSHDPLASEPNVAGVSNIYLRRDVLNPGSGSYALLSPCPACGSPLVNKIGTYTPHVADATSDLGQVIFENRAQLTADAPPEPGICITFGACRPDLYESDHGTLRFVGLIPPSGSVECGESGGPACEAAPISIAGPGATVGFYTINTISEDGSKVFFTAPASNGEHSGALYMRIDHSRTVQLNASERTDCADHNPCTGSPEPDPGGPQPATYLIASQDGSKVFFESNEQLTDSPNQGPSLYVYDTRLPVSDPNHLRQVYVDQQPEGGPTAPLNGVLGTSSDGSYVYFLTQGAILPAQAELPANEYGLYEWHEGAISLIGSVDFNTAQVSALPNTYRTQPLGARVSSDGHTLLFSAFSGVGLTGYDHGHTPTCPAVAGGGSGPCQEIYIYKADTGRLRCVSCNPTGAPANSEATFRTQTSTGDSLTTSYFNHPLSEDGDHVFFASGERLLPQDINGKSDVYEWTATGIDDCRESSPGFIASAGGCLSLITTGVSSDDSHFLDASPSGHDLFFTTNQQLVGWDTDTSYDLYDARIGGGLPEPPVPAGECGGDECQGPVGIPPALAVPSSTTIFEGAGSVAPVVVKHGVKSSSSAQKLAKALKVCKRKRGRQRRKCESVARKRFGAHKASKSGGSK